MKMAAPGAAGRWWWILFAVLTMALSGVWQIPIGTAYAIWTGVGAACTFGIGVWFFGDAASMLRLLGVVLIVGGAILLKVAG